MAMMESLATRTESLYVKDCKLCSRSGRIHKECTQNAVYLWHSRGFDGSQGFPYFLFPLSLLAKSSNSIAKTGLNA